jgi:ATP synthase protein I
MAAGEPGRDPGGEDARLTSLDQRLKSARDAEAVRVGKPREDVRGYNQGNRVLAELIAGPAGGALIGWLFDRLFGTSPWLLLALMALGIIVAFRNIFRISNERPE